uniref:Uncharacterized protein n=1 Tax=Oreochromis aureus TaxID=47969 RepID=A0A668VHY8_OREAU
MLRLLVLGLVLACAVSLSSSAVILENGAPILWAQTASQVTELPVHDGILLPDPWNYLHRMSLYRLMIAATDPFMGSMGTNTPSWGIRWDIRTPHPGGRLADPTGATTCGLEITLFLCHHTNICNLNNNEYDHFVLFIMYVQMQVPAGVQDYCTTYADCKAKYPDAMSKWDAFFQGLKTTSESLLPDDVKKDTILGVYWDAQMASTYASAACNARQSHYSSVEVSFAQSWLNSAEYVAAARFQANMEKALLFLSPLPSRILQEGDSAPNIVGLTAEENHTLYIFSWMKTIDSGTLLRLWKGAMCSVNTRQKGAQVLEQLLLNPSFATSTFLSIITEMTTSC